MSNIDRDCDTFNCKISKRNYMLNHESSELTQEYYCLNEEDWAFEKKSKNIHKRYTDDYGFRHTLKDFFGSNKPSNIQEE